MLEACQSDSMKHFRLEAFHLEAFHLEAFHLDTGENNLVHELQLYGSHLVVSQVFAS